MTGAHEGVGHQRRRRVIGGVRIEELEYADGSVRVFMDFAPVDCTFEEAVAELSTTTVAAAEELRSALRALGKEIALAFRAGVRRVREFFTGFWK